MRIVALLAFVAGVGCGSNADPDTRLAERMCARLADSFEARLRAHKADLPILRSFVAAGPSSRMRHLLDPTLNDAVETYQTMSRIGLACAKFGDGETCAPIIPLWFIDGLDSAFKRMDALRDGLRGRGSCAPERGVPRRRPCDALMRELDGAAGLLPAVRAGWQTPVDDAGVWTEHAGLAATTMASWRALIDYGLAAAPVCAPRAATSCAHVRDGLLDATPNALVERMSALGAAYRDGTRCPPSPTPAAKP